MGVLFKYFDKNSDTECQVHFCTRAYIASQEFALTIEVKDGKAVKIKSGDCINSSGWFDWDECVDNESELLEVVNKLYEEELKQV